MYLLLHLDNGAALVIGVLLGAAQGFFKRGGLLLVLLQLGGEYFGLLLGLLVLLAQGGAFLLGLLLALAPLADLLGKLHQPLLGALAVFRNKADFSLKFAHFSRNLVELALRQIDFVARGVVRLADGFKLGFDVAHIGQACFKRVVRLCHVGFDFVLVAGGIGFFQKPELVQAARARVLQCKVFLGDFGLLLQAVKIAAEFAQNVLHPREVFARIVQAVFGFAAALFVFGYASGFFQKQAQFFGFALDDARNSALPDDGVGAWAQPRAQKHVLHVAAAHGLVVDEVAAAAFAREHAFYGNLGKGAPLPAGAAAGVVKHQLHTGAAGGLARGGAVKNYVLHRLATQFARAALAQHPAHRVHDVGFAAAIGPNHAYQLPGQHKVGGVGK